MMRSFLRKVCFFWQANILSAYRQNANCLVAYRCLQDVVNEHFPAPAQQLINPYLDMMLETLDLPPKLMASMQKMPANF